MTTSRSGSDGGLFDPVDAHPDGVVARKEITRYYTDRVAEARAALAEAQERLAAREREQAAWTERGQITHKAMAGRLNMTATLIASHSIDRYQKAAQAVIGRRGGRAEAERLGERERALRRWLTAQGHNLGALALPAPTPRRGTQRRKEVSGG